MSRFDHLEIGNSVPMPPDGEPDNGQIDQHYFLEKADQAFSEANYERALTFYSRSLEYDLNLEDAWVGQLRCLIELKELQEAIIWSDRALERLPNSAQLLAARAIAELRLGNPTNAIGFVDAALSGQNVTPYVWVARGEVLIERNVINAKACFLKAVEVSPANAAVHVWIGSAFAAHNCQHDALAYFRKAVRLDPDLFVCWYWIGNCCETLGEIDDAKVAYHRASSANPTFQKARDAIGRLEAKGSMWKIGRAFKRLFGLK